MMVICRHCFALYLLRPLIFAAALSLALAFALGFCSRSVFAHESWINSGAFKNPQGEWCCGEGDCAMLDEGTAHEITRPNGFVLSGYGTIFGGEHGGDIRQRFEEFVPQAEALPSQDGKYWRCRRPDGTRRCFFYPPPNT